MELAWDMISAAGSLYLLQHTSWCAAGAAQLRSTWTRCPQRRTAASATRASSPPPSTAARKRGTTRLPQSSGSARTAGSPTLSQAPLPTGQGVLYGHSRTLTAAVALEEVCDHRLQSFADVVLCYSDMPQAIFWLWWRFAKSISSNMHRASST